MATLYILIEDCGDGSYTNRFCLDKSLIERQEDLYENGNLDYGAAGVDGDGFSYSEVTVPDGSTPESLGLSPWQMFTIDDVEEEEEF